MKILIFLFAFYSSTTAVTFNCTFSNISFGTSGTKYTCHRPVILNYENEELTAVYGTHQSEKTNDDVYGLNIHLALNLTFIPRKMENFFPNLLAMNLNTINVSSLNGDELNAHKNLTYFSLYINRELQRVPPNLFSQTKSLIYVGFYRNNLKHIGAGLLDDLQNLTRAEFRENYCINQNAQNSSQIETLIETLRTNCTDIETTTTTTTTLPGEPPACGETNEIICQLQEQNEILIAKNEEMSAKMEELSEENSEIKLLLADIHEAVLELSTRPCGI